nr:crosslink repair DNA glycosylase YcaQ family protein [Conexibacter arvalis]
MWEERTLVKTWAMRGTLHLLPAAEYGAWIGALAARAPRAYLNASRLRYFGVTREQVERIAGALDAVLRDGTTRSRAELAEAVARESGEAALGEQVRESWGSLLKHAAAVGALIFGPGDGQQVRFTHPTAWLGGWEPEPAETALAAAARRWLALAGPMTREELARWWGVSPADGRRLLRGLGDEVAPVTVGGEPMWALAADLPALAAAAPTEGVVRLLPAFDQWTIAATRHAEALLPAGVGRERIYRAQGWISPVLVVDGRFAGLWRHERAGGELRVAIEPFGRTPRAVRAAAEAEARRLGAFLGSEPALRWGPLD